MRLRMCSLLLVLAASCGGSGGTPPADATSGDAPAASDADPGTDGGPPLSWVDFAVSGCEPISADPPRCRASAPAELGFVALAPAPVDVWLWSFGEGGEEVHGAQATHLYQLPGVYDVKLVAAGPGGSVQVSHPMRVEIVAAAAGARCALDAQCAPAGECVCGAGEGCAAPLADGLCARACPGGADACEAGQVCADLARGSFDAPWRRALCLVGCDAGGACPSGRVCRSLPGDDGAWTHACFVAGLVGDVGASCVGGDGVPDGRLCASGTCAGLGARGLCTDACATSADCPDGTACATFGDGAHRCLARCDTGVACDADPWLACVAPGGAGTLGFDVDVDPPAGTYCAPKPCTTAAECGPDGACVGKYCGPA
jgi:hypothetical protein